MCDPPIPPQTPVDTPSTPRSPAPGSDSSVATAHPTGSTPRSPSDMGALTRGVTNTPMSESVNLVLLPSDTRPSAESVEQINTPLASSVHEVLHQPFGLGFCANDTEMNQYLLDRDPADHPGLFELRGEVSARMRTPVVAQNLQSPIKIPGANLTEKDDPNYDPNKGSADASKTVLGLNKFRNRKTAKPGSAFPPPPPVPPRPIGEPQYDFDFNRPQIKRSFTCPTTLSSLHTTQQQGHQGALTAPPSPTPPPVPLRPWKLSLSTTSASPSAMTPPIGSPKTPLTPPATANPGQNDNNMETLKTNCLDHLLAQGYNPKASVNSAGHLKKREHSNHATVVAPRLPSKLVQPYQTMTAISTVTSNQTADIALIPSTEDIFVQDIVREGKPKKFMLNRPQHIRNPKAAPSPIAIPPSTPPKLALFGPNMPDLNVIKDRVAFAGLKSEIAQLQVEMDSATDKINKGIDKEANEILKAELRDKRLDLLEAKDEVCARLGLKP